MDVKVGWPPVLPPFSSWREGGMALLTTRPAQLVVLCPLPDQVFTGCGSFLFAFGSASGLLSRPYALSFAVPYTGMASLPRTPKRLQSGPKPHPTVARP